MADTTSTRRKVLGAIAGIPAVAIVAAGGCSKLSHAAAPNHFTKSIDAADAAAHRFNRLPIDLEGADPEAYAMESNQMLEASRRGDAAVPGDWTEFARWVEHITDQGVSTISEKNADRLLNHVRRLAG